MVTKQQLITASNIQSLISEQSEQLRILIQTIIDLKIAGVDISTDTSLITNLQNQYSTLKTNLASLAGQLP